VRVIVEADGGSRGNPGPAGYGAVVRSPSGSVLAERSGSLGHTTNNVAEYTGLIEGLRAAQEVGATEVEARLDSKLVVEQLSGRWKVRQPHLVPLARQAMSLARTFSSIRFQWVPRNRNAHADRLANEAMDAAASSSPEGDQRVAEPPPATLTDSPHTAAHTAAQTAPPSAWRGNTSPPTTFVLLRHGQTDRSAARAYSGRTDVGLTPIGQTQADLAAKRLASLPDVAAVVSSPLRRATQTADPVAAALGLPVTVHNGLVEADYGTWDGLTFAQAAAQDPDIHAAWLHDPAVAPPSGESLEAVRRRVRRCRDELITTHPGATIVVVSHVAPIKTILAMALDAWPSVLYRLHLDLASVSIAEFYPEGASVRLANDTSHLKH
jgi:broad specificity phosphatase PhoE/ribonuclease HI